VDSAVAERLLEALNPNEIALALATADEVADRHQRVGRAAELAVDRARYEADRAERAFHAVEPENRLVASTLETRWETKLAALAEAEQALEAARHTLAPLPGRSELEKLAADLPGLWHAPATSHKDRKRLLRTVIADITLLPEPDQHKARIGIRWQTGATDEIAVARVAHTGTAKRSPSPAVAMVIELGPTTPTAELADQLNAAGLTTGTGAPFDVKAVQWIRHAYHVPAPNPYADGEISVAEAAARLGTSTGVVYDWIKTGKLDARRGPGSRLCIAWNDQVETECRTRITESGHLNPAARRTKCRKPT
jgi:excisionase family DNA binding protein